MIMRSSRPQDVRHFLRSELNRGELNAYFAITSQTKFKYLFRVKFATNLKPFGVIIQASHSTTMCMFQNVTTIMKSTCYFAAINQAIEKYLQWIKTALRISF